MKTCECGCQEFMARQRLYTDVVVSPDNYFIRNLGGDPDNPELDVSNLSIVEAETPYGPFQCVKCGKEYEELSELEDASVRTFHRRTYKVVILSETTIPEMGVRDVINEAIHGAYNMDHDYEDDTIDAPTCARLLEESGSDAEFFRLTPGGGEVDDEEEQQRRDEKHGLYPGKEDIAN